MKSFEKGDAARDLQNKDGHALTRLTASELLSGDPDQLPAAAAAAARFGGNKLEMDGKKKNGEKNFLAFFFFFFSTLHSRSHK